MCERCDGVFEEPSLGSEHPCRSVDMYKLTRKIAFEYSDFMKWRIIKNENHY